MRPPPTLALQDTGVSVLARQSPALGHHRGQPGAHSPVGFLHRPVYGELGLEATGMSTPASPLLTSCLPPAWFQELFKVLGGRKHTSGTAPLQPPSSGQELALGFYNRGPTCLASRTLRPTSTASMQQPPTLVLTLKCPGLNVKG